MGFDHCIGGGRNDQVHVQSDEFFCLDAQQLVATFGHALDGDVVDPLFVPKTIQLEIKPVE